MSDQPNTDTFPDGEHVIEGVSIGKGTYKTGRYAGRPYARFVFALTDEAGRRREVSQMLPWLAGIGFFEDNFKLLIGMTWEQFKTHRDEQEFDRDMTARFFDGRFKGTRFRATVKADGKWLNVWQLHERLAADAPASSQPAPSPAPAPAEDEPAAVDVQPAQELVSLPELLLAAAQRLGLDEAGLEQVCRDEFFVELDQLADHDRVSLLALLRERHVVRSVPAV